MQLSQSTATLPPLGHKAKQHDPYLRNFNIFAAAPHEFVDAYYTSQAYEPPHVTDDFEGFRSGNVVEYEQSYYSPVTDEWSSFRYAHHVAVDSASCATAPLPPPYSAALQSRFHPDSVMPHHGNNVHDALAASGVSFLPYKVRSSSELVPPLLGADEQWTTLTSWWVHVNNTPNEILLSEDGFAKVEDIVAQIFLECSCPVFVVPQTCARRGTGSTAVRLLVQAHSKAAMECALSRVHKAALCDRHGVWVPHTPEQHNALSRWCNHVRHGTSQEQRHFITDGLPSQPIVAELVRTAAFHW